MNALAIINHPNPALSELAHDLYELHMDYQELAEMIPADEPGSRTLPRLNTDLFDLTLKGLFDIIPKHLPQYRYPVVFIMFYWYSGGEHCIFDARLYCVLCAWVDDFSTDRSEDYRLIIKQPSLPFRTAGCRL